MQPQYSLGPIKLSPGISPAQVGVYLVTVVTSIGILQFIGLFLPFFLTEMLEVPKVDQGRLVGNLVSTQQIAVLMFVSVAGGLADVVGRRRMLSFAFAAFAILFLIYPFVSLFALLYLVHFLLGMASSANTGAGTAIMVDYPANESRGKFISMMLVVQGVFTSVLVGLIGGHIPAWLEAMGLAPRVAGIYSYACVAALAVIGLVAAFVFMRRDHRAKPTQRASFASRIREFAGNLAAVISHARHNRKFAVALIMGFAARSDSVIVISFLALWVTRAAADSGVDTATAIETAGYLLTVFHVALLLTPLAFGFVADRLSRTNLLVITCGLAGLAFVSTLLVSDVFSVWAYAIVALVGVTETSLIISIQSVMGEEAPPALRGSAMGAFAFLGSISVVVITYAGGHLFSLLGYVAPFVMVGLLNLMFALIGFVAIMSGRSKSLAPHRV
jgi:MFS family permease